MNLLLSKLCENRGYTDEFLYEINNSDYDKLKDIDTLVARLKEIHDEHSVITWLPDFDFDGISSGTLGYGGMAELGFNTRLYIPDPSKGYGFNADTVDDLLAKYPDTKTVITCDVGISCSEGINRCHELGIEVLVTDHHIQETASNADIVVDPLRMDETYSHPSICGAFVVYQILQYYADTYTTYFMQDQIRRLKVLAGFGTISDVMSLLYENRQLVKDAISICKMIYSDGTASVVSSITGSVPYKKIFWGIYYVLKMYAENGVIKSASDINEEFFGFYLAPTFNATKRMDGDMVRTFSVFFGNNQSADANYLFELNAQRKVLVDTEYNRLINSTQPYAPYIYISDVRPGILGLLAMKIHASTGYPAFVLNDNGASKKTDRYNGSGRSPAWFDCRKAVGDFVFIAGHASAFGCGVSTKTDLERMYRILKTDVPVEFDKAAAEGLLIEEKPDYIISTDWSKDIGIDIDVFYDYVDQKESFRPFGKDFPAPQGLFIFTEKDVDEWKAIGRAKEHLKLTFSNGFSVICWKQGHLISKKGVPGTYKILGDLSTSEFRGEISINFIGTFLESD